MLPAAILLSEAKAAEALEAADESDFIASDADDWEANLSIDEFVVAAAVADDTAGVTVDMATARRMRC